ncbi:hypothetical protein MPSEU_000256500 [Mayamaea pseudoterrestris]|nr:hypothetical protein MPSEU_000256500 [Mayamaea pseudoterrestris]
MSNNNEMPDKDPFQVLGVSFEATDTEINKAFRKLALKLHPDKQQNLSETQKTKMAQEFHDVQQAKAFLSDAEYASARAKYKAKLASLRLRRAADEARNKTMSMNRKRMRENLQKQEAQASKNMDGRQRTMQRNKQDDDVLNGLRKEGSNLREEMANRMAADRALKEAQWKAKLEDRQVRLKWSRKKIGVSPSDDSLAKLLQRFGIVERVEMLGTKGNSALVTFKDAISVTPCVEFYKESEELRASYIGKRKDREDSTEVQATADAYASNKARMHDAESISDWKLRREAEREKYLRQMEGEENGTQPLSPKAVPNRNFPPAFPSDYEGLEPFQKLEKAEEILLVGLITKDRIERLKVRHGESENAAGDIMS